MPAPATRYIYFFYVIRHGHTIISTRWIAAAMQIPNTAQTVAVKLATMAAVCQYSGIRRYAPIPYATILGRHTRGCKQTSSPGTGVSPRAQCGMQGHRRPDYDSGRAAHDSATKACGPIEATTRAECLCVAKLPRILRGSIRARRGSHPTPHALFTSPAGRAGTPPPVFAWCSSVYAHDPTRHRLRHMPLKALEHPSHCADVPRWKRRCSDRRHASIFCLRRMRHERGG